MAVRNRCVAVHNTLTFNERVCVSSPSITRQVQKKLSIHRRNYLSIGGLQAEKHTSKPKSPLSALSNGSLMRALCIGAVSSREWLLTPAISILTVLGRPRNSFLLDVKRNKILAWTAKQWLFKQFCAGETPGEVHATMKTMKAMGFRGTILTYAQETVFDHRTNSAQVVGVDTQTSSHSHCPIIQTWRNGTLRTVEMLGEGDQLAMKITGAGPLVTEALAAGELPPQQMLEALDEIATRCKEKGARILLDAESQHFQPGIFRVGMDLSRKFNRDGAVIFNGYQAYLKSTPTTLAQHLAMACKEQFTLGLKLVRGAYLASDRRDLIRDTKQDTDDAFDTIAQGALKKQLYDFGTKNGPQFPSVNLILASHNKQSVFAAHKLHQQRTRQGLPTIPVGYAQLQGMSDELSFGLLQLEPGARTEVYKCSTWGSLGECLGYLSRRVSENRDAASRVGEAHAALKEEARRRLVSWFSLSRK